MIQLLTLSYRSVVHRPFGDDDWLSLVDTCVRRNRDLGVSGILLFDGTFFLQSLEGPMNEVSALFSRIRADGRHHDVIPFGVSRIAARRFDGFLSGYDREGRLGLGEMGYHRMTDRDEMSAYLSGVISAGLGVLRDHGQNRR